MLLLTSGEMKKRLCDILKLWLHEPAGIQTTSITVHEEGKTDRGALKVTSREKLDDGRFRIVYRAEFRDDSFADDSGLADEARYTGRALSHCDKRQ